MHNHHPTPSIHIHNIRGVYDEMQRQLEAKRDQVRRLEERAMTSDDTLNEAERTNTEQRREIRQLRDEVWGVCGGV